MRNGCFHAKFFSQVSYESFFEWNIILLNENVETVRSYLYPNQLTLIKGKYHIKNWV